jgi:hypothetical protein
MDEQNDKKENLSEFAIASLVIGLFSFINVAGIEKAILAIVFGVLALKRMKQDERLAGNKFAKAGIILGGFSIILIISLIVRMYPKIKEIAEERGRGRQPSQVERPGSSDRLQIPDRSF